VVLIAGLAALALAIGGLTYTLLDRGGDGGGGSSGTGTSSHGAPATTPTPKPTPTPTPSEEETTPEATPTPTPSRGTSSPPPQTVQVSVAGAHTDYSGGCPPPRDQAPSFTATFTVGRLPARVDYRWVARDGEVTDSGWKTLSFPEGGGRTRQDRVTVTTYAESGTYENAISVEVRSPVHTTSDAVAFSVTCVEETPTGGASSPAPGATP
jgi:hypothetical protein